VTAAQLAAAVRKAVPKSVLGHERGIDMPALTITPDHIVAVGTYLRDEQGKNFLSAVTAIDHLGYGEEVAGYFGSERGRDINATGSWGASTTPEQPPKRFAVRYHLAHVGDGPVARVRLQVWLDDGETVPSVVPVWPTADWHEREQYDLMGIVFAGHPNLRRLILPSDWAGHPLRKDYPIGGEPVQFTDAV
jgi:NADH:ubiquinone oxidoreductase subunit C